jgi:threonine/homoserine/homoserine lactone efflux protein
MFTTETFGFVMMGALFGFTAGISPGPLLTLVITETLTHNKTAGIKVAIAPLISDFPIITIAFLLFSRFSQFNILMSLISFLGGIFLVYLGYECLKTKGLGIDIQKRRPESLIKGIIVNILNPHPYLFWLTVGTPIALKAYQISLRTVIMYFLSFYSLLIGSKIIVALIVERSRAFLTNKVYIYTMRILGFSLFIFAALFFFNSIKILKNLI